MFGEECSSFLRLGEAKRCWYSFLPIGHAANGPIGGWAWGGGILRHWISGGARNSVTSACWSNGLKFFGEAKARL